MASELFDPLMEAIKRNVSQAMTSLGEEVVLDIQTSLGRDYPPSGPAGIGPPARRTGQLQAGVNHIQESDDSTITEVIYSTRPPAMPHDDPMVPEYLETGTNTAAPRPYMLPASDRLATKMPGAFADKMRSV